MHIAAGTKNGVTLRSDASQIGSTPTKAPLQGMPPIALVSSDYASLHNSFATPSTSGMQQFVPVVDSTVVTPHAAYARQGVDSSALDTPGMTAAESNPFASRNSPALTLDLQPSEPLSQAKAHAEKVSMLDSSGSSNVARVGKQQSTAPQAPGSHKTAPPVPLNPLLLKQDYEPPPVTAPPPAPIRNQVDDPLDMTFR